MVRAAQGLPRSLRDVPAAVARDTRARRADPRCSQQPDASRLVQHGTVARVFTLIVRFDLPDASAAQTFDALAADAIPVIRANEPGTVTYDAYTVEGEPLARVFFEVYRDREAHAEHELQPHSASTGPSTSTARISTTAAGTRCAFRRTGSSRVARANTATRPTRIRYFH